MKKYLPIGHWQTNISFFKNFSGQLDLTGLPYASPARPSTVQKEIDLLQQKEEESKTESQTAQTNGAGGSKKLAGNSKSKDNSQWFSLFADLDPLANPDAIGKTTKESDPNCYSWIKFQFFKVIIFLMLESNYLLLLMVVSSWSRFLNVTHQNKIPLSHIIEIIFPHLLHRTTQKSYIITVNQNSKNLKLNGEAYLKKKTLNYNFRWFVIILLILS